MVEFRCGLLGGGLFGVGFGDGMDLMDSRIDRRSDVSSRRPACEAYEQRLWATSVLYFDQIGDNVESST